MLLVSFLEPPPHIVLSSTRALVEQICSLLLSQGREQLPQRPPSLLGSINLRDAARSPKKNKKNSRPKKKKKTFRLRLPLAPPSRSAASRSTRPSTRSTTTS